MGVAGRSVRLCTKSSDEAEEDCLENAAVERDTPAPKRIKDYHADDGRDHGNTIVDCLSREYE